MGKFKKGDPKPENSGRKKGVKNKTTQQIREVIQSVLSNKIDDLESDLEKMSPFNQWQILDKVAKYFMPALSKADDSVEHTGEININVSFTDEPTSDNPAADDIEF